jgi:hypothetical protein
MFASVNGPNCSYSGYTCRAFDNELLDDAREGENLEKTLAANLERVLEIFPLIDDAFEELARPLLDDFLEVFLGLIAEVPLLPLVELAVL